MRSAKFERKKIDINVEKGIVAGFLFSDELTSHIIEIIEWDYFKNQHLKKIAKWATLHYQQYQCVPKQSIRDIFDVTKTKLDAEEAEVIGKAIEELCDRYENERYNEKYWEDEALKYFDEREIQLTVNNAGYLLEKGDLEGAKEEMKSYEEASSNITMNELQEVFDEEEVIRLIRKKEIYFFKLAGRVGDYIGPVNRGWLIGIQGKFKGCKTWWMIEFAAQAAMSRLKVLFISLEMSKEEIRERFIKRFFAVGDENQVYLYPCFDCVKNQFSTCKKPERVNRIRLIDGRGNKPVFSSEMNYRACSWCKDNNPTEYVVETWHEEIERPAIEDILSQLEPYQKNYGKFLKYLSFPRFTANVEDIKKKLREHEKAGLVFDFIVVDYSDILKGEDNGVVGYQKDDRTWIALAQLAGEYHCTVITGTQVNRAGNEEEVTKFNSGTTAGYVGKHGHVDVMLNVIATPQDEVLGLTRMEVMYHRHRKNLRDTRQCVCLNQLECGQVNLDSYF